MIHVFYTCTFIVRMAWYTWIMNSYFHNWLISNHLEYTHIFDIHNGQFILVYWNLVYLTLNCDGRLSYLFKAFSNFNYPLTGRLNLHVQSVNVSCYIHIVHTLYLFDLRNYLKRHIRCLKLLQFQFNCSRTPSAFDLWLAENKESIVEENPDVSEEDVVSIATEKFRQIPREERQVKLNQSWTWLVMVNSSEYFLKLLLIFNLDTIHLQYCTGLYSTLLM